jgi:hypothetical protein
MGAAQTHLQRARTLFETGKLEVDNTLEGKNALIDQDLYDALIADWARQTGRPTR